MDLSRNMEKIIPISLFNEDSNEQIDIKMLEAVEFSFGSNCKNMIHKNYKSDGTGEVKYDTEKHVFLVPLTQKDTVTWKEARVPVQLRVKFIDGTVEPTDIQMWDVAPVLSSEVI